MISAAPPPSVFLSPRSQGQENHTTARRRHGGFRPDRDRRVQAARPARVRPSCPPFFRSNNRRQQRRRRRRRASRTRGVRANARFISQLACTKANLNVEWLNRFEGGVASACAVAAPPLRLRSASAPPPLRLLPPARLARSATFRVRRRHGRAAARHTSSPSRLSNALRVQLLLQRTRTARMRGR